MKLHLSDSFERRAGLNGRGLNIISIAGHRLLTMARARNDGSRAQKINDDDAAGG
ncbi:MAG: hypothetical protein U1E53_01265 [Dongiaceae bacterium]